MRNNSVNSVKDELFTHRFVLARCLTKSMLCAKSRVEMGNKMKMTAAGLFLLLFLLFVPGLQAKASVLTATDLVIDYRQQLLYIKVNDHTELYYSIQAAGKNPDYTKINLSQSGEYTPYIGSAYDAFYIDLSAINGKTDVTVSVKYEVNDTPVTTTIKAQSILKVSYCGLLSEDTAGINFRNAYEAVGTDDIPLYPYFSDETGYFTFSSDNTVYTELENIEWRAGNTMNFRPLSELNLLIYRGYGAALYFRINDGSEMISKEVKVKFQRQTNAPSVKLDGSKHTISIKNAMEYRVRLLDETEFSDWISPSEDVKYIALGEIEGLLGDGLYTAFSPAVIEVRTAATAKKTASKSTILHLDEPKMPVEGEEGIEVTRVNLTDISKGLLVTNHSDVDYQIAVINKEDYESRDTAADLIRGVSLTAKASEDGSVTWKGIKAGKSIKLAYTSFKSFYDSYMILYRIAVVQENTGTEDREYRIASAIRSIGGSIPVPSETTGSYLLSGENPVTKEITFKVEEGWTLYTAVGTAAAAVNTSKKVTFTASAGEVIVVQAYAVNDDTEERSSKVTCRYSFLADGELSCYADSWGYSLCEREDAEQSNDTWKSYYQKLYLAYAEYTGAVSYSTTEISSENLVIIARMVRLDNPELLQAVGSISYNGTTMTLTLREEDAMNALLAECEAAVTEVAELILEIYGNDASSAQKGKVIHDYLVLKKEYKDSVMAQTMAGCLTDAYTPVCMSYAMAFSYLCEQNGIQCIVVLGNATNSSGRTESHAWNIVNYGDMVDLGDAAAEIDSDTWYEMDVTWDDPLKSSDLLDYIGYSYFNVTTEFMNSSRSRILNRGYCSYPLAECTGTVYKSSYFK